MVSHRSTAPAGQCGWSGGSTARLQRSNPRIIRQGKDLIDSTLHIGGRAEGEGKANGVEDLPSRKTRFLRACRSSAKRSGRAPWNE